MLSKKIKQFCWKNGFLIFASAFWAVTSGLKICDPTKRITPSGDIITINQYQGLSIVDGNFIEAAHLNGIEQYNLADDNHRSFELEMNGILDSASANNKNYHLFEGKILETDFNGNMLRTFDVNPSYTSLGAINLNNKSILTLLDKDTGSLDSYNPDSDSESRPLMTIDADISGATGHASYIPRFAHNLDDVVVNITRDTGTETVMDVYHKDKFIRSYAIDSNDIITDVALLDNRTDFTPYFCTESGVIFKTNNIAKGYEPSKADFNGDAEVDEKDLVHLANDYLANDSECELAGDPNIVNLEDFSKFSQDYKQ